MSTRCILHTYKVYKPEVEGGIPEVISTLIAASDNNFSHAVLTARRFGCQREYKIDCASVTAVTSLGNLASMPIAPTFPLTFRRLAQQASLVIHHAPFPLADLANVLAMPPHIPLLVYWHAEIIGRDLLRFLVSPLLKATLRRADAIVVSHENIATHSDALKRYLKKIHVVPFGTNLNYWSALTPAQHDNVELLKKRYPKLVLFVGRLVPYKGIGHLIEAISKIDGQLIITGKGPLDDNLRKRVISSDLSSRVVFTGEIPRDDVKQLLHAARVCVLPSVTRAEAFGLVQLEAMAAGCPVVNTSLTTAVPHVSRHNHEGLTVPPGDADKLGQAIKTILDDPKLQARLGQAGKIRAFSEFRDDLFRSRMTDIYNATLALRR